MKEMPNILGLQRRRLTYYIRVRIPQDLVDTCKKEEIVRTLPTVYNHTKHCECRVGGRKYKFWLKHHFPHKATPEFLLVDAINNLPTVSNKRQVKEQVMQAAFSIKPLSKLKDAVKLYGGPTARNFFGMLWGQGI